MPAEPAATPMRFTAATSADAVNQRGRMDAFAALMGGRAAPRADGEDPNLLFYKGSIASETEGAKVDVK